MTKAVTYISIIALALLWSLVASVPVNGSSAGGFGSHAARIETRAKAPSDLFAVDKNFTNKPRKPNRFAQLWNSVCETALMKRVSGVCSWIGDGLRLLWAIPKAVVKGDSRSLIEAIGALLSRASSEEKADQESFDPETDPVSDEVDDSQIQSLLIKNVIIDFPPKRA